MAWGTQARMRRSLGGQTVPPRAPAVDPGGAPREKPCRLAGYAVECNAM